MEVHPIYVLKAGDELSPVFESLLSLFDPESLGPMSRRRSIPRRRLSGLMSPWCYKRLEARRRHLAIPRRQDPAVAAAPDRDRKTEPGDENNQDISSLVGKVDIRKLETYAQNDPDAYSYLGGLNRANQGPRIRRNVQGADQDAASAADGDRKATISAPRISARSRSPASFSPTPTRRRASRPNRRTTKSTVSASSRCRISCASPKSRRSTRS